MAISPLPTPAPNRNSQTPSAFSDSVDNLLGVLPTFIEETNTTASDVTTQSATASSAASSAESSAAIASAAANAIAYDTGKTGGYSVGEVVYGTTGSVAGFSFRCIQDQAEGAVQPLTDTSYWIELFYVQEVFDDLGDLAGGTDDIDLDTATVFAATISTGTQTFTFSNPAAGRGVGFTLYLTNGGSQTINWPSAVDWPNGNAPTLTESGLDVLVFTTNDTGTTWYGFIVARDVKTPT
jgi:hypothetical protein